MQRCMVQINFDRALLFTAQPVPVPEGIEVALISDVHDIQSYSRFIIKGLHAYVETTHILLMQWDGFVIHPEAWTPLFLDYNYIGATWPATHQQAAQVGNGGFSLRSKKLLRALQDIEFISFHPEDEHIARTHRAPLEAMGIRFAPPEVGDLFAYEFKSPEMPTFGFHGFSNFPDFMTEQELAGFIEEMPPGLSFNNYFLEFARKVYRPTKQTACPHLLRQKLAGQLARDIREASAERLASPQLKHLISGYCRMRLGSQARLMARARYRAAPTLGNLRLLIKALFVR